MSHEQLIRKTVEDHIELDKLFTSVDIGNAVKKSGTFIRNVDVANWLRTNFGDEDLFGDYTKSTIDVLGGDKQATLYHPVWRSPTEYIERDQHALTPMEAGMGVATTTVTQGTKNNGTVMSKVIRSTERIKIPGEMIRKLGWHVGEKVIPEKAALIKTHRPITDRLWVNKDHRVSIPRGCVSWGTDPVKVILKDGEITFERA